MINGDAYSRSHWVTYALGTVVTSVVGTKGAGAVAKTGVATTKAAAVKGAAKAKELALIPNLLPYNPKNQLSMAGGVPYNVVDGVGLKERLVSMARVEWKVNKGTGKDGKIDFTRGFDVEPKYSSYEQRVKTTPVNKGQWITERAESHFISDKTGEVKKYLDEAGVDGVEYKNGMPDFSPFSKGEVKLENMTNDRKTNFSTADEALAEIWSTPDEKWTAADIADWREDNKYTWHELNDLETIQLVPSKINSVFKHLGGVGEYNIKVKLGE